LAAVAVAVFAEDHGRADRPLGMVVIEGDSRLIEEREQVALTSPQALHQSPRVGIVPGRLDELRQPTRQAFPPRSYGPFGKKRNMIR